MARPPKDGIPTHNRTRSDVLVMEAKELFRAARRRLHDKDLAATMSRIAWEALEREIDALPMQMDGDQFDRVLGTIMAVVRHHADSLHRQHAAEVLRFLAQECIEMKDKLLRDIEAANKPAVG